MDFYLLNAAATTDEMIEHVVWKANFEVVDGVTLFKLLSERLFSIRLLSVRLLSVRLVMHLLKATYLKVVIAGTGEALDNKAGDVPVEGCYLEAVDAVTGEVVRHKAGWCTC